MFSHLGTSSGLLHDCEIFADGSFAALYFAEAVDMKVLYNSVCSIMLIVGVTVLLSLTVFQDSVSATMPITSLQIPLLGNRGRHVTRDT